MRAGGVRIQRSMPAAHACWRCAEHMQQAHTAIVIYGYKAGRAGGNAWGVVQVPLVPITILGSGDVMPSGREGELHAGEIRVIVHPPIPTRGKKTSAVADECKDVIASRLPAWKLA